MLPDPAVWVFNGVRANFPSGVFTTLENADAWIARHGLTGILTAYPLDQGVHEWAVARGIFRADKQLDAAAIGRFTSAVQDHYHYENGVRAG